MTQVIERCRTGWELAGIEEKLLATKPRIMILLEEKMVELDRERGGQTQALG